MILQHSRLLSYPLLLGLLATTLLAVRTGRAASLRWSRHQPNPGSAAGTSRRGGTSLRHQKTEPLPTIPEEHPP